MGKAVVANREKTTTASDHMACAPTPISAGRQEFASGNSTNHFHICTHSKATSKYHNQTYDT